MWIGNQRQERGEHVNEGQGCPLLPIDQLQMRNLRFTPLDCAHVRHGKWTRSRGQGTD